MSRIKNGLKYAGYSLIPLALSLIVYFILFWKYLNEGHVGIWIFSIALFFAVPSVPLAAFVAGFLAGGADKDSSKSVSSRFIDRFLLTIVFLLLAFPFIGLFVEILLN